MGLTPNVPPKPEPLESKIQRLGVHEGDLVLIEVAQDVSDSVLKTFRQTIEAEKKRCGWPDSVMILVAVENAVEIRRYSGTEMQSEVRALVAAVADLQKEVRDLHSQFEGYLDSQMGEDL